MQSNNLILRNLKIGYKSHVVLSEIDIEIDKPSFILLCGRNGSGKSTLLKTILGLINPLAGEIIVNGKNPSEISVAEQAKIFSYVAAKPVMLSNISLRQIVETGRAPYTSWLNKLSLKDIELVNQAIDYLKITHIENKNIAEVSDGERQKAMIARALAQDTPFLLLDEPTAFLDYPSKIEFIKILNNLAKQFSKTIIITSHELDILIPNIDSIWFCHNSKLYIDNFQNLKNNKDFQEFFMKIE
ncbi:MAG: ABC transporter ATP-binding protein [Bacteroidales bacterium]|nr:ABC transporter ATP-binding protein [Bacteroidales bacterium]